MRYAQIHLFFRTANSNTPSPPEPHYSMRAVLLVSHRFGRVSNPARGVVYRTRLRKQVTHRNVKAFSEGSSDLSKMPGVDQSTRLDSSASKVISTEVKHETRWLQFRHLTYTDPSGAQRGWDMVGRSTTTETGVADAVCVFATLKKKGQPDDILLVRQFRPPMNGETIELPAGLMDANESAETTALRELEEETGYIGTVSDNSTTPALPLSPGLSNETVALVKVTVDLDLDVNKNPKQKLEGSEFITVLRVQKKGLKAELDALIKKGYHVFAGLYTLAMGMEMSEE